MRFRIQAALAVLLAVLAVADAAWAAPGQLDPSFGTGGKVLGPRGWADSLALQPDGKILVGGWVQDSQGYHSALARFNPDGSTDGTFGNGGVAKSGGGSVKSILVEGDGKILALHGLRLARHLPNGSPDPAFGKNGWVTISGVGGPEPEMNDLIEQPDGKLVVAGSNFTAFVLARYDGSGTPDATFANGGIAVTSFGGYEAHATGVVLQADGELVAGGYAGSPSGFGFALVRYKTDGTPDGTFGQNGKLHTSFNGIRQAEALVIQPDGKLVAGGFALPSSQGATFALARFSPSGSLDSSFGGGGVAFGSGYGSVTDLALQPDGKVVAAGSVPAPNTPFAYHSYFAIARFNADGSPDDGFGSHGMTTTAIGQDVNDYARAIALQPDGRFLVAGTAEDGYEYTPGGSPVLRHGLARFLADDPPAAPAAAPKAAVKARHLTRHQARVKAKAALRRKFGRAYKRGKLKFLSCHRRSATSFRCSYFFKYRKKKRFGRVVVRLTPTGIAAKVKPLRR